MLVVQDQLIQFLQRFIINKTPWAHLDIAEWLSKYAGALNSGGATDMGLDY